MLHFLGQCKLLSAFPSSYCSQPDSSSLFVINSSWVWFTSQPRVGLTWHKRQGSFGKRLTKYRWQDRYPSGSTGLCQLSIVIRLWHWTSIYRQDEQPSQARCLLLSETAQLIFARQYAIRLVYRKIYIFSQPQFQSLSTFCCHPKPASSVVIPYLPESILIHWWVLEQSDFLDPLFCHTEISCLPLCIPHSTGW